MSSATLPDAVTLATVATPAPPKNPATVEELCESISATRLATWLQCRLKFWFRYLSGIDKPRPAALALGSAVHSSLKWWNRARWRGQSPDLTDVHKAFVDAWEEGKAEGEIEWGGDEEGAKATAWRLLETYLREGPIPQNERPEGVEARIEADLSSHGLPRLVGTLDLVRSGGRIVDFKTSGRTPEPESNPIPETAGQPAPQPAETAPQPPAQPESTMTETSGHQHNGHQANGATKPLNNGAARSLSATADKPAIEVAIEKLDTFKATFREALTGITEITGLLKQAIRDQKTGEKEIQQVRQTLRSLQGVKL